MQKIKFETEQILAGRPSRLVAPELIEKQGISGAVVYGAAQIARRIQAKMVVIATAEGQAALVKSKQRDFIPTIAVTNRQDVLNRMCLYWGITPVYMESLDGSTLRQWIHQWTTEGNILNNGDRVVLVLDTEVWPGVNDTVHVVEIG